MTTLSEHSELVEAEGHLIDSQLLNSIFDKVIERGAKFEVLKFEIGRTNDEFSHLKLKVTAADAPRLQQLLEDLMPLGCHPIPEQDAALAAAEADGVVPDSFYSTTNHQTHVRHRDEWVEVSNQRMDGVIVIRSGAAACRKLRDVRQGDSVVCGVEGIRVSPEFLERDRLGFAFMTNDVSSERPSRGQCRQGGRDDAAGEERRRADCVRGGAGRRAQWGCELFQRSCRSRVC